MTNYWEARIERLNKETFRNSDKYVRELRKLYEQEMDNIEGKIYNHLSKLQEEAGGISLFDAKKLLNDKELDLFKMDLDGFMKKSQGNISPELEKELNIVSRRVRISRLQAMEVELKKTVAGLMSKEENGLFDELGKAYQSRFYKELYELQRITGYDSVRKISKEDLNIILKDPWTSDGREFSQRIWDRGDKLVNSLKDSLTRNIASGASPKESIKDIESQFNVSKAAASRLVYTETAAISSKATQDSYKRIGVKKYEILATLDLKTSDICRSQDGKTYDIKDYRVGITAPPFHPNCRTDTIPFFDDDLERQLDKNVGRMARNPENGKSELVENLSYEDWHKKYVEKLPNNNQGRDTPNEPKEPRLKYTEAETNEAIEEYVSGDGMWINNKLRGIGEIADYPLSEDDKIYLEKLDQATQGQIVKEKTLYRSVDISSIIGDISDFEYDDLKSAYIYGDDSKRAQETLEKYLKHIKGKEIVDKGFMSTTKSKDIALEFQGFTGSSKPCVIEFNVPKGIKGIDLKAFDIEGMEQKEVLLARNQKFVIKEVRQEQGQFYFKADLIPNNGYNIDKETKTLNLTMIQATSIDEANKLAENMGFTADYKGIDLKCANEWNLGLFNSKRDFPEVSERIKFVGSSQKRYSLMKKEIQDYYYDNLLKKGYEEDVSLRTAKRWANQQTKGLKVSKNEMASSFSYNFSEEELKDPVFQIMNKYRGITMNNKLYDDYEEVIESGMDQVEQKWHPDNCYSIKSTFDHEFGHQIDSYLNLRNDETIKKIWAEQTRETMKEGLSEYAYGTYNNYYFAKHKDSGEMIAEAWSEYCNSDKPRKIADTIGKEIEKLWKAKKNI